MNLRDKLKPKPPPIPPHAAAQLAAAGKPVERKRRNVQEVKLGDEQPSTVAALDDVILKHSHRLLQKIHLVVSVGPISPLTWLQSMQLKAEIGLAMRQVAASGRWFERYRRRERSVEVDQWPEDEPTLKNFRQPVPPPPLPKARDLFRRLFRKA